MVIRRKLKEGELSIPQQVYERIRLLCGESEENFYGNLGAAKEHVFQSCNTGMNLVHGFFTGLWVGIGDCAYQCAEDSRSNDQAADRSTISQQNNQAEKGDGQMKHARPDYDRIQDPAGKIPADEPVFLLRAQDVTAAAIVREWADLNERLGGDPDAIRMARNHAALMQAWDGRKLADV